jgi:hypothetical protein
LNVAVAWSTAWETLNIDVPSERHIRRGSAADTPAIVAAVCNALAASAAQKDKPHGAPVYGMGLGGGAKDESRLHAQRLCPGKPEHPKPAGAPPDPDQLSAQKIDGVPIKL